ncbi:MAG: hypothetical protein JJ992_29275 [Planctomycetes bacterium]|nr:hypothetical protein [Planctomycetota bacterium]
MASRKLSDAKLHEWAELAAAWGKLLAQQALPGKPGLDVTLADMEGGRNRGGPSHRGQCRVDCGGEASSDPGPPTALPNLRQDLRGYAVSGAP